MKKGWDSKSVIANVTGLNAFIDGHSHTMMQGEIVKDKAGKKVVLTQTGSYLDAVGMMTIAKDGKISTQLLGDYEKEDEQVAAIEAEWIERVDWQMNEKIAFLENPLYTDNPQNEGERWIRSRELNLGDFVADSVYWFFNDRLGMDCDVVLQNGGGIRNSIPQAYMSQFRWIRPISLVVSTIF